LEYGGFYSKKEDIVYIVEESLAGATITNMGITRIRLIN